jgi:cytochrome P450
MEVVNGYMANSPEAILKLPAWVPTPRHHALYRAVKQIDELLYRIIAKRRSGEPRDDLLGTLLAAQDDEGARMSDEQLRDEAITLFLAGHETTANALTFTWLLLSRYPQTFRELRSELQQILGGRSPGIDDLPKLTLTRRILQESMRLYPPAWIIARSAIGADEIGGYEIPARSILLISPYVVHRHPGLWEDPEGFDPQRFASEPARGAYLPFGGGPRMCIGNAFATMEAELVLATLAQRLQFDLVPGSGVELEPSITLRPRNGVKMRIR